MWRIILSWLPFDDLCNCRLVCKDWLDLLIALPEFKSKNCLKLDFCTLEEDEPPVTTLLNSKVQFGSMKIGSKLKLGLGSPNLIPFFGRIGETITYLDISKDIYSDSFRLLVENLNLFKVLYHFNVGSLTDWLQIACSSSPGRDIMKMLLHMMTGEQNTGIITYESAKKFLDDESISDFRQSIILKRNKELMLEKIMDNLDELNNQRGAWNVRQDTVGIIVEQVEKEIQEADKLMDLSPKSNVSVRHVSLKLRDEIKEEHFEKMFLLVPNVQEINISCSYMSKDLSQVLEKYAEKITSLELREEEVDIVHKLKLTNLKVLRIRNEYTQFRDQMVERCLDLFPSIRSISAYTSLLPKSHFDYITELGIQRKENDQLRLSELTAFKQLKILKVSLWTHLVNTEEPELCFFGHKPVVLEKVEKLNFNTCLGPACLRCIETMLQSLPKLRDLDFMDDHDGVYMDLIFKHQTKLEKLKILSRERSSEFIPKHDWSDMKKLRVLILSFDSIKGDESAWDVFTQKISKLKFLQINAHECVNLLEMIGCNMPLLQQVSILVRTRTFYPTLYPTKTKTIVREGRKLSVDEYGP